MFGAGSEGVEGRERDYQGYVSRASAAVYDCVRAFRC